MTTDVLQLEGEIEASDSMLRSGAVSSCNDLLAVSFGGGDNSTALLCGLYERNIKPAIITFADPKGEYPHTIRHLEIMQGVVRRWWGMEITVCWKTYQGRHEGLEAECLRGGKLPALAYGSRACSKKYKTEPQDRVLKRWLLENRGIGAKQWREMKKRGERCVTKLIGYHADEAHRTTKRTPDWWHWNRYPLVEWQWAECECRAAMNRHGITPPGKSSCFFCPAHKPSEVIAMRERYPELLNRALEIERRGDETTRQKRGLGGENNYWSDWLAAHDAQEKLFDLEPMHIPCGCSE